jgi:hypothetical protein
MTDDMLSETSKGEDIGESITNISHIERNRRPSEVGGGHILFAPDPRQLQRRATQSEIAPLTLARTFSRQSRFSSYSAASDDENARARRAVSRRAVEPHTRLPTGT